jgi:spore coat polysaccharide biosynthesis protein SpsF
MGGRRHNYGVPLPRTIGVIQARMGSTRLPGKVLRPIAGRPMLEHVVERVRAATGVDAVCVATTTLAQDDVLADWCAAWSVSCHRGPELDVLARTVGAARGLGAALVVRVTSDCPLYDPRLLDEMLAARAALPGPVAHYSNCRRRSYPRGLDTEIVSLEALEAAASEAQLPSEREHVTPYILSHPERYATADHLNPAGDWSAHRWTVDAPEDLELVRRIYGALASQGLFGTQDVLRLLEAHPDWLEINAGVRQKQP